MLIKHATQAYLRLVYSSSIINFNIILNNVTQWHKINEVKNGIPRHFQSTHWYNNAILENSLHCYHLARYVLLLKPFSIFLNGKLTWFSLALTRGYTYIFFSRQLFHLDGGNKINVSFTIKNINHIC